MKFVSQVSDHLQEHPLLYSFVMLVVTAAATACILGVEVAGKTVLPGLEVENSLKDWFQEDDPARLRRDELAELFGGDEFILVAFEGEDLFTPEALEKISHLSDRFYRLPDVTEVNSLVNANEIRSEDDVVYVEDLFEKTTYSAEVLERKRHKATSNVLYKNNVLSEDGRTTAL
jgi:predicted RND superfamily exporter protein